MAEGGAEIEFLQPTSFEWDRRKNELNRAKHGIDFDDARKIFYGPIILRSSDRNDEERWIAIGSLENRLIAVIFTWRRGHPDNLGATRMEK